MTTFFESPQKFRSWLKSNGRSSTSLKVGFRKRPNGHACMSFEDAVEEALCAGWCAGRNLAIDALTYSVVFRARPANAKWAPEDLDLVAELVAKGKMSPAGRAAYEARAKPKTNGHPTPSELSEMMLAELRRHAAAWTQFQRMAPSHRRKWTEWVMSAKLEKTKSDRFARLLMDMSRPRA